MTLCSCSWPGAIVFRAMQHRPRPTGWQLLAGGHLLGRSRDRGKGLLLQLPTGRRKPNLPALASRAREKLLLFQWEPLGKMVAVYRLLCGWGRVHGFYRGGHWTGSAWTSKIGNTIYIDDVVETRSALLVLWGGDPPITFGFPSQKASNAGLGCFFFDGFSKLWQIVEQSVEQTIEIEDDAHMASLWRPSHCDTL